MTMQMDTFTVKFLLLFVTVLTDYVTVLDATASGDNSYKALTSVLDNLGMSFAICVYMYIYMHVEHRDHSSIL